MSSLNCRITLFILDYRHWWWRLELSQKLPKQVASNSLSAGFMMLKSLQPDTLKWCTTSAWPKCDCQLRQIGFCSTSSSWTITSRKINWRLKILSGKYFFDLSAGNITSFWSITSLTIWTHGFLLKQVNITPRHEFPFFSPPQIKEKSLDMVSLTEWY